MFTYLPVYLAKSFQKCAWAVKNFSPVSTSDLCSLCRSQDVDTGCLGGREEDLKYLPRVSSAEDCPSPSVGVLEIQPQARPHVLDLPGWTYNYVVTSFLLGSSRLWGLMEMSLTLNMLLPFPGSAVCPSSLRSSHCLDGLGAKITLETLLLANSFSWYKYIIYIYILYYFWNVFVFNSDVACLKQETKLSKQTESWVFPTVPLPGLLRCLLQQVDTPRPVTFIPDLTLVPILSPFPLHRES